MHASVHRLACCCVALIVALAGSTARATVESATIVIDSATTQPVGTGLIPTSTGYDLLFLTEGAYRVLTRPYTEGWISASGQTRLIRAGQPDADGVFAKAVFGIGPTLAAGRYVANQGSTTIQSGWLGNEIYVGLNMSDIDLSNLQGTAVIHVILVPRTYPETVTVTVDAASGQPVDTGLFAAAGDEYLVLVHGAMRFLASTPFNDGWFGPEGMASLNRVGEQIPGFPYGAVLGTFGNVLPAGFYIGDGGSFTAQLADLGDELRVGVNMSDADLAASGGAFHVSVIRIPSKAVSSPGGRVLSYGSGLGRSYPNPMAPSASIPYTVAADGPVLLRVYDVSGRWVRTLVDEERSAGPHEVRWDGRDEDGRELPAGVYFCQLSTDQGSETEKLTIVR